MLENKDSPDYQVCGKSILLVAKAKGKMYSDVGSQNSTSPTCLPTSRLCITKKQLHLGITRATGNMHARQSKRVLALEPDLTLISPSRKKRAHQTVFAQGSTPKYRVMPTQMGPVK